MIYQNYYWSQPQPSYDWNPGVEASTEIRLKTMTEFSEANKVIAEIMKKSLDE